MGVVVKIDHFSALAQQLVADLRLEGHQVAAHLQVVLQLLLFFLLLAGFRTLSLNGLEDTDDLHEDLLQSFHLLHGF